MRASRGEIKIRERLEEAELNFKMEYIFPDLKSPNGRPLRFDFVVFDDDGKIYSILKFNSASSSISRILISPLDAFIQLSPLLGARHKHKIFNIEFSFLFLTIFF